MEPLSSTLNEVLFNKIIRAMSWGTLRDQVDPGTSQERVERRRLPLTCERLQVNSIKLGETSGSRLGVKGGEGTLRSLQSGRGEKLAQQDPLRTREAAH